MTRLMGRPMPEMNDDEPEPVQPRRMSPMLERLRFWFLSRKTYLGMRRRTVVIAVACVALGLLALIVGLAAGLTKKFRSQNLPLPSNSETFTGELTYYAPALGACGITSSEKEDICAVSRIVFDAARVGSNPNANPLCGLKLRATRYNEQAGGQRSVDLTVVDRCVGCKATDIDLSPAAFKKLADPDLGRVSVTWAWL